MSKNKKLDFAAIVVTFFTGPSLWQCLDACRRSGASQIIVVSNGNSPATMEALKISEASEEAMILISGHGNIGFSRGCNLGAEYATTTNLLFINPDAVLLNGSAELLMQEIKDLPVPSMVGGRVLNENLTEQRGARRGRLTPASAFASMTGLWRLHKWIPSFENMHWEHQPLPQEPVEVPAVSGACMMMRRQDFDALGGFDERYFLHVEDLDICRQARRQGGKVIFHPRAELLHFGSTSRANIMRVNWNKATGLVRYFLKFADNWAEEVTAWIMAPMVVSAIMGRAVWIALFRS